MEEIIDERTVETIMFTLLWAGPVLGVGIGLLVGAVRKQLCRDALYGLALGCLGILNFGLWKLYSYLVRYDPKTGYHGLERVDVLLLNVAIFCGVGVLLGLIWGWVAPRKPEMEEAEATEGETIRGPVGRSPLTAREEKGE